jgi:glucokinase
MARATVGGDSAALVGDIGGTNARFAIRGAGGRLTRLKILPCADYGGPGDAMEAYLDLAGLA